ncbi:MAG: hypothetical protein AB7O97_15365 [Planctomycetota bacterium]
MRTHLVKAKLLVSLVAAFGACGAAAAQESPAQEPPAPGTRWGEGRLLHVRERPAGEPRWTLWVTYASPTALLPDHASWLAELQSRYADRAVRVVVAAPDAAPVAAAKPGFDVVDLKLPEGAMLAPVECALMAGGGGGEPVVAWGHVDGARDRLEAALDGEVERTAPGEVDDLIDSLLYAAGDGGQTQEPFDHCVQKLPLSGRTHGGKLLFHWWSQGDYAAARATFDRALEQLAGESVPLVVFADLALRGDRTDRAMAQRLAMALAPAAAGAADGVLTQLVYLRALLRAGQDRMAGRVAAVLPKLLEGRPLDQLVFAETLMEAEEPAAHRDLAERALARARAGDVDARWAFAAEHEIVARCGGDTGPVLQRYRAGGGWSNSLNNDAWYLSTELPSMGRFPTLALAQVETMVEQDGDRMSYGNMDTVALVMFLNGRYQRAVELQTRAAQAAAGDPRYQGRLRRFEAALERQQQKAPAPTRDR